MFASRFLQVFQALLLLFQLRLHAFDLILLLFLAFIPGTPSVTEFAAAAQKVQALSMSVRQTESYVQGLLNPEKKPKGEEKEKAPLDPNVREARDLLQRALGLKVSIEDKNGRGRVIIEYSRLEDFDALLETIAGK